MKYVTYLRVSTSKQGESGLGIEAQRATVNAFVRNNPIIAEYCEVESGKKNLRPELLKAIDRAKSENATLLIAKLDRLSRNAAFILNLKDSGVKFQCCDMPNASTLTVGVFAVIAQNTRENISDNTRKALHAKKEQGFKLGKPENLTREAQLKGAEANRIKAKNNPSNQRAKSYAVLLRDAGKSYQAIAENLNTNGYRTPGGNFWVKGSVHRLLGGRNF